MKIGFIGLGTMGMPMAQCLASGELNISGWDTNSQCRSSFDHCAQSIEQLSEDTDVFITMLPEAKHVLAVVDQLLEHCAHSGCLFIDCSTIDVDSTRQLAERLACHGHGFVDAPVSGGREAAEQGTLSFMLGGKSEDIQRARPLLEIMGSKLVEFGQSGSGQAAKACHNMICGITALGVCESFALADALGLDMERFFELCKGAAAQSWILENRCPVPGPAPDSPASNDYAPGFAARLMAKDLGLAQQAATSTGQKTPFGEAAAARFQEFADKGDGELDFSAIYQTIRG
ncbi:MAG: 3-hydroxyisobutyrate dehydrogenase [Acidiferrobacterales bacterium]|nr:3-hydroxyisobutyrate dehydrogenase [Acidiferrobacterales bacterium]